MRRFGLYLALICFVGAPFTADAARYHWKFIVEMDEQSVGDKESKFKVGDWECTVGGPTLDKAGTEMRRLGCSVDGGPQVFLLPVCYKSNQTGKPKTDGGVLNLQMKHSSAKSVALACESMF